MRDRGGRHVALAGAHARVTADLPIEVRRLTWGWFGPPWPGYVCYADDGRLLEEMRKPTPVGEACSLCAEPVREGDRGQAILCLETTGPTIRHVHAECGLRNLVGPADHLDGRCTCRDPDRPARPYRAEALEVWARLTGTTGGVHTCTCTGGCTTEHPPHPRTSPHTTPR